MVWFQCEDCGENLKKPKLPNHFRVCSAYKLSCIDCGKMFDQESVQSHTQCISEAEKYGPKDQGKAPRNTQAKPEKPMPNADVDVNVGLSSRPPWFCSLCNTSATSKQTLLLHADGKKHRAKARAFHAAQKQSAETVKPTSKEETAGDKPLVDSTESDGIQKEDESKDELHDSTKLVAEVKNESSVKRKRKIDTIDEEIVKDNKKITHQLNNGEVIHAGEIEGTENQPKKKKLVGDDDDDKQCKSKQHKIKWKKLVTSTLKSNPDQTMKIKKLQKTVLKMVQEYGVTEDEAQLCEMLMDKINASSRFVVNKKRIQLVAKAEEA